MIGEAPLCMECKHYNFNEHSMMSCEAYPKGIPEEIIMNEHDHHKPFKNDNGITFEPIRGKT